MTEKEAQESLDIIRKAIDSGAAIFRSAFISRSFGTLCIIEGLLVAIIFTLCSTLKLSALPLAILIAADIAFAAAWKIKSFRKGADTTGYEGNILQFAETPLMKGIITTGVLSLFLTVAIGIALAIGRDDWSLAYPVIMTGFSVMFITYAGVMKSYSYGGAAIASAAAAVLQALSPALLPMPLWIAYGFGAAILLLGVLMMAEGKKNG